MNKPWSCGTMLAGIILVIIFLAAFGAIDLTSQDNTTANIVVAHKACEAQTGQRCD